jgi:hypothetical protein
MTTDLSIPEKVLVQITEFVIVNRVEILDVIYKDSIETVQIRYKNGCSIDIENVSIDDFRCIAANLRDRKV